MKSIKYILVYDTFNEINSILIVYFNLTSNILIILEKDIDSYFYSNCHTHRLNDLLVVQKH